MLTTLLETVQAFLFQIAAAIAAAVLMSIAKWPKKPWKRLAIAALLLVLSVSLTLLLSALKGTIPVGATVYLIPQTNVALHAADPQWGCPPDESSGFVTPAGVLDCSGLRENARYTLCINEFNGKPPAMVLRKIEITDNGEGYWDVLSLQTNGKGEPPGTKLQGTVPEGASGFYYDKPYHVKLFVKDEEQQYCPALYSDQFVFRFEKVKDQ